MNAATYLGITVVVLETIYRTVSCGNVNLLINSQFNPALYYSITYLLCMVVIYLNIKTMPFFKLPLLRNFLSILHAIDGFIALILGLAAYYESNLLLLIGVIGISKIFLLHLLCRMVTGEVAHTHNEVAFQTTKSYIHHVGSFLFLPQNKAVILITALWRFNSMNGHAALTFRHRMKFETYELILWKISHIRNFFIVAIITASLIYPDIRRGLGKFLCIHYYIISANICLAVSAVGHASYLIVRIGPVFRIGSIYLAEGEEKNKWGKSTDSYRLNAILKLKYPYFTLELGLMLLMIIYLLGLRLFTNIEMTENCYFV